MASNRVEQMMTVQKEGLELFKKKNADYGDSFANFGPIGVIVRMGDKINRLSSVTNNGVNLVNNESVRDTLIDLHNYAAMAIMLLDEKKILYKDTKMQSKYTQTESYRWGGSAWDVH
jgi:hypothetical protein